MKKIFTIISFVVLLQLFFPVTTLGAIQNLFDYQQSPTYDYQQSPTTKIGNPLGQNGPDNLPDFIARVLQTVVKIGATVVVFFVIYSGFLFVTAQGNEEKLKKAKQAFLYTMIGAAILLGAQLIALVISGTINNLGK
jgi:hypothetical protein